MSQIHCDFIPLRSNYPTNRFHFVANESGLTQRRIPLEVLLAGLCKIPHDNLFLSAIQTVIKIMGCCYRDFLKP